MYTYRKSVGIVYSIYSTVTPGCSLPAFYCCISSTVAEINMMRKVASQREGSLPFISQPYVTTYALSNLKCSLKHIEVFNY